MFSYIVTGVILLYNDIVMIILCIFAVFGFYSLLREFSMLFSRRSRVSAAVFVNSEMSRDEINEVILNAEDYIYNHSFLHRYPIIINDGKSFDELKRYGCNIYVEQTEEK